MHTIRMIASVAVAIIVVLAISHALERYASSRSLASLSFEVLFVQPASQVAATLEVGSRPDVRVGDLVAVPLILDLTGATMNALEGAVTYAPIDLDLARISTSDSILNVWIHQPALTASGTISFAGGVLPPGYSGSDGTVFTMWFKARRSGMTRIGVTDARLLAYDGLGTEIPLQVKPLDLLIAERGARLVGDLDGDGAVDFSDLLKVVAKWGKEDAQADLDGDGSIDVGDLRILLLHWSSN